MIEDALKSTRTLHRLIMTVALVTIVFSLSLSLPQDKSKQKEIIDGLIAFDFAAYEQFVEEQVAGQAAATLRPIGDALTSKLEDAGHLVFGLDKLGEAFSKPVHVGKLLTGDLILNDVSNATLAALEGLNGLSLDRDVQILVPRAGELLEEISAFLEQHPGAGKRVDTIRLNIDAFDFNAESFLPGTEVYVGLYFELLDAVRVGGAPAFSANFVADIKPVPDTSFLHWLRRQEPDSKLVALANGEVKFASELDDAPTGVRTEKLGVLSLRLADEIASSGPARQSVSILGTNVPGSLVIFASPIILISLAYYFYNHTSHLRRLCGSDEGAFAQFAWLPLSLDRTLEFTGSGGRPVRVYAGVMEVLMSGTVLPLLAIGLLYLQLSQFGDLSILHKVCMAAGATGIAVFGLLCAGNISAIKHRLASSKAAVSGGGK